MPNYAPEAIELDRILRRQALALNVFTAVQAVLLVGIIAAAWQL